MREHRPLTQIQKRWIAGIGIALFLLLSLLICWFAGRPLIQFAREPELFRQWVDRQGIWAPLLFMGMVILQIVVAVIPGEPLEIAAGYAFGALEGTLWCLLGAFVGRVMVFLLVRRFGARAVEVFFPLEKLQSLRFLQNERRLTFWVFFLFFLPGTPKDVLCYIVGLTNLPLRSWLIISTIPHPLHHHLHHRRRRAGHGRLRLRRPGVRYHPRHQRPGAAGLSRHLPGAGKERIMTALLF